MAATLLCAAPVAELKKRLLDALPRVKSSHLSEALAFSLGFKTSAAMVSAMRGPEVERPLMPLNAARWRQRIEQLGYAQQPEIDFDQMIRDEPIPGVVSTVDPHAWRVHYATPREKAYRNFMVAAVNAALRRQLFSLVPGDRRHAACVYFDFELPNGRSARGYVAEDGTDRLAIHAAVNPRVDWLHRAWLCETPGDAHGQTLIDRRVGAWIESLSQYFTGSPALVKELAAMQVQPACFGDRGVIAF